MSEEKKKKNREREEQLRKTGKIRATLREVAKNGVSNTILQP